MEADNKARSSQFSDARRTFKMGSTYSPDVHMINRVLELMINYNSPDMKRINHAIKVFRFARYIAEKENCVKDVFDTVCIASLLHDIGIHNAELKHNSSAGRYQEIEGPSVALELLRDIPCPKPIIDRVLFLIGHHHSYGKIDDIDFRILVEADFIVNIDEDHVPMESIASIKSRIFRTETGTRLLDTIYK